MDPATQAITEIWQTSETINEIWSRIGWLNVNLIVTNALLGMLIFTMRNRKDGEK